MRQCDANAIIGGLTIQSNISIPANNIIDRIKIVTASLRSSNYRYQGRWVAIGLTRACTMALGRLSKFANWVLRLL
jgi:hypothetical protein